MSANPHPPSLSFCCSAPNGSKHTHITILLQFAWKPLLQPASSLCGKLAMAGLSVWPVEQQLHAMASLPHEHGCAVLRGFRLPP